MFYVISIAVTLLVVFCMYCNEEEKRREYEQMEEIIEALKNK